jgi:hypothetical protein
VAFADAWERLDRVQGQHVTLVLKPAGPLDSNAHQGDLQGVMTERRYNEEEVAAIFERAAQAQATGHGTVVPLASSEGMTLGQLQDIGREVGLSPAEIETAARGVARAGEPTSRKVLGVTIGVGRTVELDRKITEEEWERLVVDLRETFDARGRLKAEGSFRQWTNGNLQALLEPTENGHRLRLKTVKGDVAAFLAFGGMMLAVAVGGALSSMFVPNAAELLGRLTTLGFVGGAVLGVGLIRLPSWTRTRRQQMAEIAARLAASTSK